MKTNIKEVLKNLKALNLKFENSEDEQLLNSEKNYHLHDRFLVNTTKHEYTFPCLVEIEIGNSKVFNLQRIVK